MVNSKIRKICYSDYKNFDFNLLNIDLTISRICFSFIWKYYNYSKEARTFKKEWKWE